MAMRGTTRNNGPVIGRLQPEAEVRYEAIFAVLNSLSMCKGLIKGFSRVSRPHQIE
jgi:hypothetical protein